MKKIIAILLLYAIFAVGAQGQNQQPHLAKQGTATQLIVDGKPFLILGGELGNSTASALAKLDTIFSALHQAELNTVLVPAYWELIEPAEGKFDFTYIDAAINKARTYDLKVVILWFGAWKNSMSCYAPLWIKENYKKYPRTVTKAGQPQEILTAFSANNLEADKRAFVALMEHIHNIDAAGHTVIMMQVENEIGMIPDARDYCKDADKLFNSAVPKKFIDYLISHKSTLHPQLLNRWESNGLRTNGIWTEIFGEGLETDELFTAWNYGVFVEEIVKAGKKTYSLPVYLNAALNSRGRKPGAYPSGGPLAHLLDVWRAAAPSVDFIAPDIYDTGFAEWCALYHTAGNPLFIPEIKFSDTNAAKVFYAFGEHDAMGFSPFSIEDISNPQEYPLTKSYYVLSQLLPLLTAAQGKGNTCGFWFDDTNKERTVTLGNYRLIGRHVYTYGWSPQSTDGSPFPEVGALVIKLSDNEFLVAGTGVAITFANALDNGFVTGIASIDKVQFEDGKMIPICRMNGDQSHQGRHLRIEAGEWNIQYIKLYNYK
ncbi:MAG: DUF5597 domain-containing protein [Prevotellaceae bacterium]|jgi:hypothetical protein|nr:DUF5597 domain-containing protein [Prevotellaceae bacterium]